MQRNNYFYFLKRWPLCCLFFFYTSCNTTADSYNKLVVTAADSLYSNGVMFDMQFDLKTDNRMYCAEFVYKSFLLSTNKKLSFNISHIKDFAFIGVDDIILHPLCRNIKRVVYK